MVFINLEKPYSKVPRNLIWWLSDKRRAQEIVLTSLKTCTRSGNKSANYFWREIRVFSDHKSASQVSFKPLGNNWVLFGKNYGKVLGLLHVL